MVEQMASLSLGSTYIIPIWEQDPERNRNGSYPPAVHSTEYGIFIGTHKDYLLFASPIPTQYTKRYKFEIYYIHNSDEDEISDAPYDLGMPLVDDLVALVASHDFHHPNKNPHSTTSTRVNSKNIAEFIGKHKAAKKIAAFMESAPPALSSVMGPRKKGAPWPPRKFTGGPYFKNASTRSKVSGLFKNKTHKKRRNT